MKRKGREDSEDRKEHVASAGETSFAAVAPFAVFAAFASTFLAFHLPYLPKSLEDLDSINFALGVRHFDVAAHQPHPPGYPLYILMAKGLSTVVGSEVTALSVLSVVCGALGVIAIAALARRLFDRDTVASSMATVLAIASPIYWFTAARPLSDVPGLAAAVAIQACTLAATTPRMLFAAAGAAGLAMGLRSQVAWLTLPLLLYVASGLCPSYVASAFRRTSLP